MFGIRIGIEGVTPKVIVNEKEKTFVYTRV